MDAELHVVYKILIKIIETKDTITYQELSDAYSARTGYSFDRRSWGGPLGEISRRCTDKGLPPISTIVVSEGDKMPGPGYWGIPSAPPYKDSNMWSAVRKLVNAASWPPDLP